LALLRAAEAGESRQQSLSFPSYQSSVILTTMATCIVLTFLKTGKILHAAGVMISSAFLDRDNFKSPISNQIRKK
jgi:hypothetical protein